MALDKTLRTHTCGELNAQAVGRDVTLCGWVHSRRDHGGVIFADLRDRHGLTQVVFEPSQNQEVHDLADSLRREWVVQVRGTVRPRGKDMVNPKLATGEIELVCAELNVLNKSEPPPFELDAYSAPATDAMRLKYRYMDLRRDEMQAHLYIRHRAAQITRDFLSKEGFLEIETPMLVRSTPEGARDFLVPSRMNPGGFYSLPQSPQLYKQLLMVSGADRYFQIARCFRDEDLRSDRQPEFTQIDIEASFIKEEFIYDLVERMVQRIFKEVLHVDIALPVKRFTYGQAMDRYGTDKPDLRFGLPLTDVSETVKDCEFTVFRSVLDKGGIIKCVCPTHDFSRGDLDGYIAFAQQCGARGMAWMKVTEKGLESNIVKYFSPEIQKALLEKTGAGPGATLMFIAGSPKMTNDVISRLRNELGKNLGLIKPGIYEFCWVTQFPMFEYSEAEKKWSAVHHPFTSPLDEDISLLYGPEYYLARARAYDFVLNGNEVAGGSIRIHDPGLQKKVFELLEISTEEAERKFGFLLEAFKYGAPPHGGIASGFDRLVTLLCGHTDIREVIAFPKTASGTSLLDGCPSAVDPQQLKELKIKSTV